MAAYSLCQNVVIMAAHVFPLPLRRCHGDLRLCQNVIIMTANVLPVPNRSCNGNLRLVSRRSCHGGLLPVPRHGSRHDTSYAKDVVFMVTYVLCQDVVVMAADVLPVSRRRCHGDLRPVSRRRCHGGRRTSCVKTSLSWRQMYFLCQDVVVMVTYVLC